MSDKESYYSGDASWDEEEGRTPVEVETVLIKNIKADTDEKALKRYFHDNGIGVSAMRLDFTSSVHEREKFAFVDLSNPFDLQFALQLDGKQFRGCRLIVVKSQIRKGKAAGKKTAQNAAMKRKPDNKQSGSADVKKMKTEPEERSSDNKKMSTPAEKIGSNTIEMEPGSSSTPVAQTGSLRTPVAKPGSSNTPVAKTGSSSTSVAKTGLSSTPVAKTGSSSTSVANTGSSTMPVAKTGSSSTHVAKTGSTSTPMTQTGSSSTDSEKNDADMGSVTKIGEAPANIVSSQRIYIGKIAANTTDEELKRLFSQHGVTSLWIQKKLRHSFAFADVLPSQLEKAKAVSGTLFKGRAIYVDLCRTNKDGSKIKTSPMEVATSKQMATTEVKSLPLLQPGIQSLPKAVEKITPTKSCTVKPEPALERDEKDKELTYLKWKDGLPQFSDELKKRCWIVRNLTRSTKEADLNMCLPKSENIIMPMRGICNRGFAYIIFPSKETADPGKTGIVLHGKKLLFSPASSPSFQPKAELKTKLLQIKGLPVTVTDDDLKSQMKNTVAINIWKTGGKQAKSKGKGVLEFATIEDAEEMLDKWDGKDIGGQEVELCFWRPSEVASDVKTAGARTSGRGREVGGQTSKRGRGAAGQPFERGRGGVGGPTFERGRGAGSQPFGRAGGPTFERRRGAGGITFERGRGAGSQPFERGRVRAGGQTFERGRVAGTPQGRGGPVRGSLGEEDRRRGFGVRGTTGICARGLSQRGSSSRVMVGVHNRGGLMGRGAQMKSDTLRNWEDKQRTDSSSSFQNLRGTGRGRGRPLYHKPTEWSENVDQRILSTTSSRGLTNLQRSETVTGETMFPDYSGQNYSEYTEYGRWEDIGNGNARDLGRFGSSELGEKRSLMDVPFETSGRERMQSAGNFERKEIFHVENVESKKYFGDAKRKKRPDMNWPGVYVGDANDWEESGNILRTGGNKTGDWRNVEDGQSRNKRPGERISSYDYDDWRQPKTGDKRVLLEQRLKEWEEVKKRPRKSLYHAESTRFLQKPEYRENRDFQQPMWEEEEKWQPVTKDREVIQHVRCEEWSEADSGGRKGILTSGIRRFQGGVVSERGGQHGIEARSPESGFGRNLRLVESHEREWKGLDVRTDTKFDYQDADDSTEMRECRSRGIISHTPGTGGYGREAVAMRLKNLESSHDIEGGTGWGDLGDPRTHPLRSRSELEASHGSDVFHRSNDLGRFTDRKVLGKANDAQKRYQEEERRIVGLGQGRGSRDEYAQENQWELYQEDPADVETRRFENYGGIGTYTMKDTRQKDSHQELFGGRMHAPEPRKQDTFGGSLKSAARQGDWITSETTKYRGILKKPPPLFSQLEADPQFSGMETSELDKFKAWQQKTRLKGVREVSGAMAGQGVLQDGRGWGGVESDTHEEVHRSAGGYLMKTAEQYGLRANFNRGTFERDFER
ncbi:hypothetical protein ScPMuIL_005121 [Solemya velum]